MKVFVAVQRPIEFDTSGGVSSEAMQEIDRVNDEMIAAGERFFAGGLQPLATMKSIRRSDDGELKVIDGPSQQLPEYLNGFWILEVEDMEEAIEWGRKAAAACQSHIEIRPFH